MLTRFKQENLFNRYFPYAPKELLDNKNVWLNWQSQPLYYLGGLITGHILSYISPINLSQRVYHWVLHSVQNIPTFSIFGWTEAFFLVIGLLFVIKRIVKKEKYRFLIYWILGGALPAAVTWNWFHPLRSLNIYPALEIIIALGLSLVFSKIKIYKSIIFIGAVLLTLGLVYTVINEYNYSIYVNNGEFQPGGFKEGMKSLMKLQNKYDQIIIDSPHAQSYIFFLFYQSFPPEIVQSYSDKRPKPGVEGDLTFDFYKYKFRKFDWPAQKNYNSTLFWVSHSIKKDEIVNTKGADLILVPNAVNKESTAIITKE